MQHVRRKDHTMKAYMSGIYASSVRAELVQYGISQP